MWPTGRIVLFTWGCGGHCGPPRVTSSCSATVPVTFCAYLLMFLLPCLLEATISPLAFPVSDLCKDFVISLNSMFFLLVLVPHPCPVCLALLPSPAFSMLPALFALILLSAFLLPYFVDAALSACFSCPRPGQVCTQTRGMCF